MSHSDASPERYTPPPPKVTKHPSPQPHKPCQTRHTQRNITTPTPAISKPIAPNYPKIGGQHKDYLFVALKAYKQENNAAVGRSNGIMGGIAKQFSTAELKAMADYIGSLDGDLKTVPDSRFHH